MTRWVVAGGLGWALLATRKMWGAPRQVPRAPLWRHLPELPGETRLYVLMLAALTAIGLGANTPLLAFLPLALLLCLFDWTRFRPWLYQNTSLLLVMALAGSCREALDACRLILASVYFWAGALKANAAFVNVVFPWFLSPFQSRVPAWLHRPVLRMAYLIPILEAGLGLGLLFPSTRWAALLLAAAMHSFILLCFSRHGHTQYRCIWPWNVSMLASAVTLFAGSSVGPVEVLFGRFTPLHLAVLGIFTLLPILGLFNRLDPVFSHGHMAGRHVFGFLALSRRLFKRLPEDLQQRCVYQPVGQRAIYVLDIGDWYLKDLQVPHPQQERLLQGIARSFARYGACQDTLQLTVFQMPHWRQPTYPHRVYSWSELVPEAPAAPEPPPPTETKRRRKRTP